MGEHINYPVAVATYFCYGLVVFLGLLRDFFGKLFGSTSLTKPPGGLAPLAKDYDDFFTRRMYRRLQECFNRPIASAPGVYIDVLERARDPSVKSYSAPLRLTGQTKKMMNLGSYNYLGFADNWAQGPCAKSVLDTLHHYSASMTSPSLENGTTPLHTELEQLVAKFVNKEAAMIYGMGFATNSTTIPALMGKGSLIISDSLNHASIAIGCKASGAKIRVFKHGDMKHLERVIRESIVQGQPKSGRAWKKILIMVEGIYSMEGDICDLASIVALKNKYKCYLYVDEAHSIGALGRTGRGVCEYRGVDTNDIDILMGTFTKSFGSVGGYVAASKDIIDYLRTKSFGQAQMTSMSPVAAQQSLTALQVIMGLDGTTIGATKLRQLNENTNYFRNSLLEMGVEVVSEKDSPVIPVLICMGGKILALSRECYDRGLAVVVVGFPATPVLESRVRFCISAAHTRDDLDKALAILHEVFDKVHLRFRHRVLG